MAATGRGRAKKIYAVQCNKHSTEIVKGGGKEVKVQPPSTKAQRKNMGCPYCKTETQPTPQEQP